MEKEIRKTAIELYLNSGDIKAIFDCLNRSKNRFFKWLQYYQTGDPNCFKGKSRAPVNRPTSINPAEKKRIVENRRQ